MRWGVKNSRIHIKQINASRSIVVRLAVTYMHVDIIIQMYVQIRERGGWRKEGEREREREREREVGEKGGSRESVHMWMYIRTTCIISSFLCMHTH